MKHTALLIVDVQKGLIKDHPFRETYFLESLKMLVGKAREQKTTVIYIRHDGGAGDDLEKDTDGWKIWDGIPPQPEDKIFDKQYNSAFRNTGLKAYLDDKGITDLILVGMQTEYCIDTTCKTAFEHGYHVIIPSGLTTTFDNGGFSGGDLVRFYEEKIWQNRFAQVLPVGELF